MKTQTKAPRIVRGMGRVELWVLHNSREIAFAYPLTGPFDYRNTGNKILQANQELPTGEYTASLLHAAYCSDAINKPEFENIREVMKNRWLWVFNVNTWTDKGVYSMKDLEARGRSDTTSVKQLEEMLKGGKELSWGGIRFSENGRVGFAPKGSYSLGEHTPESLAKDGLVVATYNVEGAEKLGEVSKEFRLKPKTWGIEIADGNVPEKRVSAVYDCDGGRLDVDGGYVDGDGGVASGVLVSAEGTQKI